MLHVYFDDEYVNYDAMDVMDHDHYYDDYSVSQRRFDRRFGGYCATYVHVFNPRLRRRICYREHQRIRTIIRDHTGTYRLRRVRFVFDCRDCHRRDFDRPGRPDRPRPFSSDFIDEF